MHYFTCVFWRKMVAYGYIFTQINPPATDGTVEHHTGTGGVKYAGRLGSLIPPGVRTALFLICERRSSP